MSEGQARNFRGKFVRDLDHLDRDRRAAELVTQGMSYAEAADALGYPDKTACWRGVQFIRQETTRLQGTSEQQRQAQLAEMEELRKRLWSQINDPLPLVDRVGRIVHDDDGHQVPDAAAIAAAEALLVRVNERIARIRGTDAPRKSITVTGKAPVNAILSALEAAGPEDLREAIEIRRRELERATIEADQAEAAVRPIPGTIEPADRETT